MFIYSIKDVVAEEFGPLFVCKNNGLAIRAYLDATRNVNHIDDYKLYLIGEFNEEDGVVTPYTPKEVEVVLTKVNDVTEV